MKKENINIHLKEAFLAKTGYAFKNIDLLRQALTHTSYANEHHIADNERLEFLGDAVLELTISDTLYHQYPNDPEGHLTRMRANIVRGLTIAEASRKLGLGYMMFLGKGERLSGGELRTSLLADVFEATIGAIYLDSGLEAAQTYILQQLKDVIQHSARTLFSEDYKTTLQEFVQSKPEKPQLAYKLLGDYGPDHDKVFKIGIYMNEQLLAVAEGRSKKQAEQKAANKALNVLKGKS